MDQINVPLPAVLSEWEKPYSLEYFEKKGTVWTITTCISTPVTLVSTILFLS